MSSVDPICSVRSSENNWYKEYFAEDKVIWAPFRNLDVAVKEIRKFLNQTGAGLSGALTYQEESVITTQYISAAMGLAPICVGNPSLLRNKAAMRKIFWDIGIPQPKYILCSREEEAVRAVRSIGVPCVIKPVELLASLGVRKIEYFDDKIILKAFNDARHTDIREEDLKYGFNISSEVLVEEYIPTIQEISVEGAVYHGQAIIISITKKYLGPEPKFEEIGHATPFLLGQETFFFIKNGLRKVANAQKLNNTIFHAEFRLRKNAPPVLVEIAARLAGDSIPMLVEQATGVNMFEVALSCAIDTPIQLRRTSDKIYAVRFITDPNIASKLKEQETRIGRSPYIKELILNQVASEGRFGHVIWHGDSIEEIEETCPVTA